MSYKCISPQLKSSCYNCKFYRVSTDMLNGLCYYYDKHAGKAAIGIGTCNHFSVKGASDDIPWRQPVASLADSLNV
ncbi:hypothetical protein [Paenibacillus koleovorans]|uniref:hypothetical protein n=1 Tax=Paenibacillus koleovorans TaxID=121608 RepID=UPI000FDB0956|nr:hypothetical protein [Paenibacillus koleovorans]